MWIDEIEKGSRPERRAPGTAGRRRGCSGTFLSWMQEKTAAVFVIATREHHLAAAAGD